jgi:hypothetical protein
MIWYVQGYNALFTYSDGSSGAFPRSGIQSMAMHNQNPNILNASICNQLNAKPTTETKVINPKARSGPSGSLINFKAL